MRSGQLMQIHNRNGNGIALIRRNTSQNTCYRKQQNQDSTTNSDQQQVDSKKSKKYFGCGSTEHLVKDCTESEPQ